MKFVKIGDMKTVVLVAAGVIFAGLVMYQLKDVGIIEKANEGLN